MQDTIFNDNSQLKLCECGCNKPTRFVKGRYNRFIIGHNWIKHNENHPSWKGGRRIMKGWYVLIKCDGNANADKDGYVFEHVLQMQKKLNRALKKGEQVHHINGIKDMNVLWNLQLVTVKEHRNIHKPRLGKYIKYSARHIRKWQQLWKWLFGISQVQEDYYNKVRMNPNKKDPITGKFMRKECQTQ